MDTLIFEVGTALVLVAFAAILAAKLKFSIIPFLIILVCCGASCPRFRAYRFKIY